MKNQEPLIQTGQRLEIQMSQLANPQNERLKGSLPSQPVMNLRNSQQAHLAEDQPLNQCNVVHTLRSGKKVDNQVSTPSNSIQHNHTQASTSSSPNFSKSEKDKSTSHMHKPIVPFLNRLKKNKQNPHMAKIIEIFNQVKINVPLLDSSNKSHPIQNFLRICASRRERLMFPRKSS